MIGKKKLSILLALSLAGIVCVTAVTVGGSNGMFGSAGAFQQTKWTHFSKAEPKAEKAGCKEYWTDCVGGDPIFTDPGFECKEGGVPSDNFISSLSETDSRYIAPTKNVRSMVKSEQNLFTVTDVISWNKRFAYYYFDTFATTAYVEIKIPKQYVLEQGNDSTAGITITNGSTLETCQDDVTSLLSGGLAEKADYEAVNLGICRTGIKVWNHNTYGSKSRSPGADWVLPNLYYNKLDTTEKVDVTKDVTFGVFLENNAFRTFINGREVYKFEASSPNFLPTGFSSADSKYKLGVFFGNGVQKNSYFNLTHELYGDDAINYLFMNHTWKMARNGNNFGNTELVAASKKPVYQFLTTDTHNEVVVEAKIPVASDNIQYYGMGFTCTDGVTKQTDTSSYVINDRGEDGFAAIDITLEKYGIGLGNDTGNVPRYPGAWGNRGKDKFAALLYDKSNADKAVSDDPMPATLLVAYHSGRLYCYINGKFIVDVELSNKNISNGGYSGIPDNSPLKFGILMYGITNAYYNIELSKELYGNAAVDYMKANLPDVPTE